MAPDELRGHSPAEVAYRLTDALNENTSQLKVVRRRQRLANVLIGILTVVVIASGYLFIELRSTQQEACRNSNDVRSGLLNVADNLEAMIQSDEPAVADFINDLRSDFAILEC